MEPNPRPEPPEATSPLVLHASWRGLLVSIVGPGALLILGGAALVDGGFHPVPLLLVVAGGLLGAVALYDIPRRVEFDRDGLTRVCPVRRHRIPWSEVVAIERGRPSSASVARNSLKGRRDPDQRIASGGLIARGSGRTRWLLLDQVEGRDEHEALRALVAAAATPVQVRAPRPHLEAPPTTLYRRQR